MELAAWGELTHTIHNEYLSVTVSKQGAQLQSILGADGTEYLWQGDSKYWSDRALNLFPYVARMTRGSYYLDGTLHHMDIHGIAPYRRFSRVEQGRSSLTLELASDGWTRAIYPREFTFRVRYSLVGKTLFINYEVENWDKRTMYFGLGGHPGFNVPLTPGKRFSDYRLHFGRNCQPRRIGFTEDCLLNGTEEPFALEGDRFLPLSHALFDWDAIVLKDMDRQVTLETVGDPHAVTVTFPRMDYLGIWHMPKTDAPYVCIEPWCSLPSTKDKIPVLEEQPDLISLASGETYRNQWSIQIA